MAELLVFGGNLIATSTLLRLLLIFSTIPTSFALFSQTTRWHGVSIQKNSQGTFCYVPEANAVRETACKGSGAADFATVLDVHLNQGLSIAYYNGVDNAILGGSNYSLPAGPNIPIIRLCVSGKAGDGHYRETVCVNAVEDNRLSNSPYCQVAVAQKLVSDGCYEPSTAPVSTFTSVRGGYTTTWTTVVSRPTGTDTTSSTPSHLSYIPTPSIVFTCMLLTILRVLWI